MSELARHQELCEQFAALLCYPDQRVAERAAACSVSLRQVSPAACGFLDRFRGFIEASDASRIEEAFTGTFELQALCHPYVGFQLCGESQQRTMFMIKLRQLYRQHDFTPGNDLPDHLGELLRFLAKTSDQNCRQEIIQEGLLPALVKMSQGIDSENHPYLDIIMALQSFLTETAVAVGEPLSVDRQKEYLS